MDAPTHDQPERPASRVGEVIRVVAPLAWVAFGGPQAHLALLHERIVDRRRWVDDQAFVELYGMCSILPGPTSTQTVIGLGVIRAGFWGGLAALLVWAFPAVSLMTLFALGVSFFEPAQVDAVLAGVRPAAVGLVAVAAWKLGQKVVKDAFTVAMLALGTIVCILYPRPLTFPLVLLAAGLLALWLGRVDPDRPHVDVHVSISRRVGAVSIALFVVLLVGLNLFVNAFDASTSDANPPSWFAEAEVIECFYRNSSLIFGGGQVLLPLLETEAVMTNGWLTATQFGNGLGVMQSLPGPLFSFSAYIGGMAALEVEPDPTSLDQLRFALLAAGAIFLPAFLLLIGVIPFWSRLRRLESIRRALVGVNACAVGLVVAAVWLLGEDYVTGVFEAFLAVATFIGVIRFRLPAPAAIILSGVAALLVSGLAG
ncbi:MAG: chromate efflux transporter [Phycisphaerales bacterium]